MALIGMNKPLELVFLNLVLFAAAPAKAHANFYSIVYPTLMEARSVDGTKVVALNEEITLNLVPTDVFSDAFVLSTALKEGILHREFDTSETRRTLYHDEVRMAAVSIRNDSGILEVKGVIGETLRIEPLPFSGRRTNGQMPHRLFLSRNVIPNDKVTVSPRAHNKTNTARRSDGHLNHVVVELFILCDTKFLKFFTTDAEMTDYLAITVAAVNLKYKSLQRPTIKFSIVGLLKLNELVEKIFMTMSGSYLERQPTLLNFMRFAYRSGLREADVTYLVTGMDMSDVYKGRVNSGIAGLAYVSTLCAYDGVSMGEDRGAAYSGVDIMAHELAHSLGCVHDGDGPYRQPAGHQGSKKPECDASLGYIMSPRRSTSSMNRFKFSPCCQEQMTLLFSVMGFDEDQFMAIVQDGRQNRVPVRLLPTEKCLGIHRFQVCMFTGIIAQRYDNGDERCLQMLDFMQVHCGLSLNEFGDVQHLRRNVLRECSAMNAKVANEVLLDLCDKFEFVVDDWNECLDVVVNHSENCGQFIMNEDCIPFEEFVSGSCDDPRVKCLTPLPLIYKDIVKQVFKELGEERYTSHTVRRLLDGLLA